MAVPLSAQTIAEIRDLAASGTARNDIARRLGISAATVTKYAPAGSFDRSATEAAVKAHKIDASARRAILAERFAEEAERLLDDMRAGHLAFGWYGKDGDYRYRQLDEPPPADKRALMAAAATAIDRHLRLVDHDSDGGLDEARSVLDGFMDAVARRAAGLDPQ
jgi:hypothetical protein